MKKLLFTLFICTFGVTEFLAQGIVWSAFTDSITSFSSPRAVDLNGDGILDIVVGGGIDGVPSANGIMAYDGSNGNLLWKRPAHDEIFVSANFQDITGDGILDVFIGGREAQFYAIDGSNGALIWEFYPHPFPTAPGDSGLWNFYSPQFIPDVNGDGFHDILLANGGDHSLPLWEQNRPPGHLMILNAANGSILAKAVVPDSAETYCSPLVVDLKGDGNLWVLFGTGGESLGGSFYVVPLSDLVDGNIMSATQLATHASRGFIAPPAVHKSDTHNGYDIVVQGFGGTIYKFDGQTFAQHWSTTIQGTESSAQPVLGNFTGGDFIPDVFAVLYKGNMTSYTDYYQVMLDGVDGSVKFIDSIGTLHFPSGNAVDLNNDGRDEAIASITYHENGYFHHKLIVFDFQNNNMYQIHENVAGTNLGCTPMIKDIDDNGLLDLVYVVRADSLNPVGVKGIHVFRYELATELPNVGVAWGSYLGTNLDGVYDFSPVDCGFGSVIQSVQNNLPSCNGLADGSIQVNLSNGSLHHTFLWSNGSVNPSLQNIAAGIYTIRVTNSQGCYEDRELILNDPYQISYGGVQSPTCVGGNNGMVAVSSSGCPCMFNTCVFTWSDGFNGTYNDQLTAGEHTLTIVHPDGCIVEQIISIPEGISAVLESVLSPISCAGNDDAGISIAYNADFEPTFSWSTGQAAAEITNLSPGEYVLTVFDNRPCVEQMSFVIDAPEPLELTVAQTDVLCFGGLNGSVLMQADGGTPNYQYSVNGVLTELNIIDTLAAGMYSIFALDAHGCTSETLMLELSEAEQILLLTDFTPESGTGLNDGSASVEVIAGGVAPFLVTWDDPQSQNGWLATNLSGGVYHVQIVDANGCVASASVHIQTLDIATLNANNWLVYPNPTKELLYIQGEGSFVFELRDLSGKLVMQGDSDFVRLNDLAAGNYLLQIHSQNSVFQTKIIVVR